MIVCNRKIVFPALLAVLLGTTQCTAPKQCESDDFGCRPELGALIYLEALNDQSGRYQSMILEEDGLIGYWRLEETTGSQATDLKSGRHGTYSGGVTLGQSGTIIGNDDFSPLFDGSTGQIAVAHHDGFNFNSKAPFSVEVWVNAAAGQNDTSAGTNTIIGKGSGGSAFPFELRYDNTNGRIELARGDGTTTKVVEADLTLNTEVFYHLVAVRDTELSLYINGTRYANEFDPTGTSATNSDALTFGRSSAGDRPFTGNLDEIAIYEGALDSGTILTHYRFGVGLITSY